MKAPNITPSDWRLSRKCLADDISLFGNCDGGKIATVHMMNNYGGTEQDLANAKAIAALPKCLKALEFTREAILKSLSPGMGEAMILIEAALIEAGYTEDDQ